ncbi:MAG: DUF1674 domain-containing protein [Pseudomonadota bacterium]
MNDDHLESAPETPEDGHRTDALPRKPLSPAAKRALAEAEARRTAARLDTAREREIDGRGGLDPARFGDWEVKGIASDF